MYIFNFSPGNVTGCFNLLPDININVDVECVGMGTQACCSSKCKPDCRSTCKQNHPMMHRMGWGKDKCVTKCVDTCSGNCVRRNRRMMTDMSDGKL